MLVFGLLLFLGLVVLGGVISLALSKKSSATVRTAALCALGLMMLTVLVCLFIFFWTAPAKGQTLIVVPDGPVLDAPAARESHLTELLIFAGLLLGIFLLVFFLSSRERRRLEKEKSAKTPLDLPPLDIPSSPPVAPAKPAPPSPKPAPPAPPPVAPAKSAPPDIPSAVPPDSNPNSAINSKT